MEEGKWKGAGRQRPVPARPCAGGGPVGPDTLELGTVAHFKDVETEALRNQVTPDTPGTQLLSGGRRLSSVVLRESVPLEPGQTGSEQRVSPMGSEFP